MVPLLSEQSSWPAEPKPDPTEPKPKPERGQFGGPATAPIVASREFAFEADLRSTPTEIAVRSGATGGWTVRFLFRISFGGFPHVPLPLKTTNNLADETNSFAFVD